MLTRDQGIVETVNFISESVEEPILSTGKATIMFSAMHKV